LTNDEIPTPRAWYLRRQGHQVGPFTSGVVRRLLLQGQATLDDEVSEDCETWQRVDAVPEVVPPELRPGALVADVTPVHSSPPWLSIALFMVVVGGAIGFGFWWGGDDPRIGPDCHAPPAPGIDWHNCRLSALKAPSADLRGANMQNADLAEAALAGADLSGARLDYAILHQADLGYALLRNARLRGADLRGTDLGNADLSGADLGFADLTGARVAGANLTGAHLDNAIWMDRKTCAPGSLGGCLPMPDRP